MSQRCGAGVPLVLLAGLLVLGGCIGGERVGPTVARVESGNAVEIAVRDVWRPASVGDEIPEGARVRTGDEETRLAFRSGEVWLGPRGLAELTDDRVQLVRGELMVDSEGHLGADWTDIEMAGEGIYRLSPGVVPRLGVYEGHVRMRRASETRRVSALREMVLSARRLPVSGQPLTYRADDPWDMALLADAIAFDGEARRLARGLVREYGTRPRPAEFYASFVPSPAGAVPLLPRSPEVAGDEALLGPPADALLTLFVAQSAAADGTAESLAAATAEVVELREARASWGLIAGEFRVTTRNLAAAVETGQALHSRRLAALAAGPDSSEAGGTAHSEAPPAPDTSPKAGSPPPAAPQPGAPQAGPDPAAPPPPSGGTAPAPPAEIPADPTDLLGQQPRTGLIESVVDLVIGGS